ncbi:MAG TPA: choice-of-anchor D domain-containing protein, partial [Candidatus Limnocylindria bacterium]|nr:choice-of-anchor D domain-containing protein [Candidatus Limnocylindria bacterium]
ALDAAVNIPGGFDPEDSNEVNFGRDSLFSWAFHSSLLGSAESPVTADEAFVVEGDQSDPIAEHGDALYLFTYLLTHPTGVGQYFLLPRLLAGILGPWLPDQYSAIFPGETHQGGYEADILTTGTGDGLVAQSIDFKPTPAKAGISGGGVPILDGDTTPSVPDGTDFATVPQGGAGPARTFTVRNDGGSPLTLGAPSLPAGFSLVGLFPATVAAGDSATFTLQLDTTAPGTFAGLVSLPNNGSSGPSFSFTITGTVLPPPAPPVLTLIAGPALTLQVAGDAGVTYTVEFAESLDGSSGWQAVKTLAVGESWTPPAETPQGFFRVRIP